MPNLKGKASNIFEKFQAVREYKAGALRGQNQGQTIQWVFYSVKVEGIPSFILS